MDRLPNLNDLTDARGISTLPAILGELSKRLEDSKTSSEDMGKIIQKDQVLSSKVLRLVNSPFYGYTSRIRSISQGIMILGFNAVKNLVLTTSVLDSFRSIESGKEFRLPDLWLHSAAVSCAAKVLAEQTHAADPDEAFVAGLIHDIGKVALWNGSPELFSAALQQSRQSKSSFGSALQKIAGYRDEDIGTQLAAKWKFPDSLCNALRDREKPPQPGIGLLPAIIQVSSLLACAAGYQDLAGNHLEPPTSAGWQALGLSDPSKLKAWITASAPGMKLSCTFLEALA